MRRLSKLSNKLRNKMRMKEKEYWTEIEVESTYDNSKTHDELDFHIECELKLHSKEVPKMCENVSIGGQCWA